MLRAEVGEDRIGEVALHQFRGPQLPVFKKIAQRFETARITMTAEKLAGSRRRAGTEIEKGNVHFAFRERAVDERQITNHGSEKAEAKASFRDDESARQC